ncbi:hypothetical protein TRAPUB_2607 [Trametes pubescens]|uniref:F-box domain-containing protein n=1 Tax=Trametes pubescens TaxID=154538 RepID=A0A1M2VG13_TRAPU|nr:hypothetical protein TRAPUB_2607 [Trametes pubescens]
MGPHPALLVDEILREVFTHLRLSAAEPKNTLEHKQAFDCCQGLSNAVQVCRAFYGPAISELWRVLPEPKVAWSLFPSFTLVGDEDTQDHDSDLINDEDKEDGFPNFMKDEDTELTIWLMYPRNTEMEDDECEGDNLLLQTMVPQLQNLRELQVYAYVQDIELSLSLDSFEDPDGFSRIRGFFALQTLTRTEVDGADHLSPFASPTLHTLTLCLRIWKSAILHLLFHDTITQFPVLRSLAVDLEEFGPGDQETHTHADIPDFQTLFGMLPSAPVLEEFSIRTPTMLTTAVGGDRELARFTETWPHLRALRLVTMLQGVVSPATLIAFARHCPQLHTLHLRGAVICDTMAEWLPEPPLVEGSHGLRELGVCRPPPLEDPGAVASFLHVVFPDVRMATSACCAVCTHAMYYAYTKMPDVAAMLEQGVGPGHEPPSDGAHRSDV